LHFQVISTVAEIFWDQIKAKRKRQPGTRSQLSQAFPSQSTDDIISFLKNQTSDDVDDHVCLLIHNIDGPALRDAESQQCLAQLSCCPHVHIVASIDHVNAPLCKFLLFYCIFVKVFLFFLFIHSFSFFFLVFDCLFSFFDLFFYHPSFSPLFFSCFSAHVVSSLAYSNLLGTERLGCCCFINGMLNWKLLQYGIRRWFTRSSSGAGTTSPHLHLTKSNVFSTH
jgi:hypothetical protein